MLVVFDTNVWLSEFGLKTTLGAATRFFLLQKGARIALPEVVRMEVVHHLRKNLGDYIEEIRKNHRQLLSVFGTLKEVVLPDESAIEARIEEVFSTLGVELFEIPFSFESARSSFLKTIDKVAPSDKDQQFKDGVIWADCVELLKTDDVALVCKDKAFYEGRDYSKGVARNLKAEIKGSAHTLTLYPELKNLLEVIKTEVHLDDEDLIRSFFEAFGGSTEAMLTANKFEIGGWSEVTKEVYATLEPNQLAINFEAVFGVLDTSDEGRTDGRLTLRGDGMYDSVKAAFGALRNFGEKLTWKLSDGTEKMSQNYVGYAGGLTVGHREVSHTVRYKLD